MKTALVAEKSSRQSMSLVQRAGSGLTLILLGLALAVSFGIRISLNFIIEPLKNDFALTDASVGILLNIPVFTQVGFAIITGIVSVWRRGIRVYLVAVGVMMSAVALLPTAFASNYTSMLILSVFGGAGAGMTTVAAFSLAGECLGNRFRPVAIAVLAVFITGFSAIATVFVGQMSSNLSWREFLTAVAAAGLFVAAILPIVARDRRLPRQAGWRRGKMAIVFIVLVILASALHATVYQSFQTFQFVVLVQDYRMSVPQAAIEFVRIIPAFGSGAIFAGLIAALLPQSTRSLALIFFVFSALFAASLAANAYWDDIRVASPFYRLGAVALFAGGYYGVVVGAIVRAYHVDRAAFVIGILVATWAIAPTLLRAPVSAYIGFADGTELDMFEKLSVLSLPTVCVSLAALLISGQADPVNVDPRTDLSGTSERSSLLFQSDVMPEMAGSALKGFGISFSERLLLLVSFVVLFGLATATFFGAIFAGLLQISTAVTNAVGAVGGVIGVVTLIAALSGFSGRSKRRQQHLLRNQEHNFALYLRPFSFDLRSNATKRRRGYKGPVARGTPVEEALGSMCLDLGLGLKGVGPVDGQYGVDAISASEEEWQTAVLDLMRRARLIMMVPGPGEGCTWEIEQIVSTPEFRNKTIWIMPPSAFVPKDAHFAEFWSSIDRQSFQGVFPDYDPEGCIFDVELNDVETLRLNRRPFTFARFSQVLALLVSPWEEPDLQPY